MNIITKLILWVNLAIQNMIKLFPVDSSREYCRRKKAKNI